MAPRQRISPQPSLEEPYSAEASSPSRSQPEDPRPLLVSSSESSLADPRKGQQQSPDSSSSLGISEVARERHDVFNLIALLFVLAAMAVNFDFELILQGYGPAQTWTGDYFWWMWGTCTMYFVVDLWWLMRFPRCVKSPATIIKHHLVVITYMIGPIVFPEYRWMMGALLSVEINTWLMILRRVVHKRPQQSVLLRDTVSFTFYLSWIVIRCYFYPYLLFIFYQLAKEAIEETKRWWHWPMLFIPVHFALCILNLKWSYDLFLPIFKRWFLNSPNTPISPSSGL